MDRTSLKDLISFLIDLISQGPMGTNHNPLELDWIWLHQYIPQGLLELQKTLSVF